MFAWLSRLFRRQSALPAGHELLGLPPAAPDGTELPEGKPADEVKAAVLVLTPVPILTAAPVPEAIPMPAAAVGEIRREPASPEPIPQESTLPSAIPHAPVSEKKSSIVIQSRPMLLTPEYRLQRSQYFSPAKYGPLRSGSVRLLAPDLAYRARQAQRGIAAQIQSPQASQPRLSYVEPAKPTRLALARFFPLSPAPPRSVTPDTVGSLDPSLFSALILHQEGAKEIPPEATAFYVEKSALASRGRDLRDLVLENWENGGVPLTPGAYFALASSLSAHRGTAMLLCHNVAKAFARGGVAIPWQNRNRVRGEYGDGSREYLASVIHKQGLVRSNALYPPSIFYLLFSPRSLGVADTGDWYRYFSYSTLAVYQIESAIYPSHGSWETSAWTNRLDQIAGLLADLNAPDTGEYKAWLWANTIYFAEWATWGRRQDRALDSAQLAVNAVRFAFSRTGVGEQPDWQWFIPGVRTLAVNSPGREAIHQILRASEVRAR